MRNSVCCLLYQAKTNMASDDEEIPETGAIFTFGKTRFAENLANKFWIRDDKVLKLACGDEHSAVVTCSGRLYTFGNNDWGQLGHGNTKPYSKPSLVKKLKGNKVKAVNCGRSHTLVISESGVFSFGAGADSQLGHGDNESYNVPTEIEALNDKTVSQVACGAEHSAAVTDNGELYMWGSGSEGQLGLGLAESELPSLLKFRSKVTFVACGYYHTAVITELGKLYTFGDNEAGKLGLEDNQCDDTEEPQQVKTLNEPAVYVACGGNHTAVLTKRGSLFTFGSGMHGQLGHGPAFQDVSLPKLVSALQGKFVSCVSCGESHTAIVTKHGELFTFGDGRHGKLGMGDESFSNLFKPTKVSRFRGFNVEQVSCGGCHMLTAAARNQGGIEDSEGSEDNVRDDIDGKDIPDGGETTPRLSQTVPMLGMSARDKRRQKDNEGIGLASSLPPLNRSSLPPLASLGISNIKKEDIKPSNSRLNPLDRSTLPIISIKGPSLDDEENCTEKQQLSNSRRLPPRPKRRHKRTETVSDSEEERNREQRESATFRPTPPPRKQKPMKDNERNNEDNTKKSRKEQKGRNAVEKSGSEASDEDSEEDDGSHSTGIPNSRNLTEGKEAKKAEMSNENAEEVSEEDAEEEGSEGEGSGGKERETDERKEDGRNGSEIGKSKNKDGKDVKDDEDDDNNDDEEESSQDEETDDGDEAVDNDDGTTTKTKSLEKNESEKPEVTNVDVVDSGKEEDEDKKKKDNSEDSKVGKRDTKDKKKKGKTKKDEAEQEDGKEKENEKDKKNNEKDKGKQEKKKGKIKGKEEQENRKDEEENEEDNEIKDSEKEKDASMNKEGKKTKKSGICVVL